MKNKKLLFLLLFLSSFVSQKVSADWQQILESNFDIAESFDNLQDWSANGLAPSGAGGTIPYDSTLLPKKIDGTNSRWGYWNNKYPTAIVQAINNGPFIAGETVTNDLGTNYKYGQTHVIDGVTYVTVLNEIYGGSTGSFEIGHTLRGLTSGATATIIGWPKIIADHGENKFGTSGKSLMMNLGDNDNSAGAMAGIGAQRMGVYFGDGNPKSGYKKIHLFVMIKFSPTFFGLSGNQTDITYSRYFKFLDLCTGFRDINHFGSTEEQQYITQTDNSTTMEYGANNTVLNLFGGGASFLGKVTFQENPFIAGITPGTTTYESGAISNFTTHNNDPLYPTPQGTYINSINQLGAGGEWFGLEIISYLGTVGNSDGTTDLYIYDKTGAIRGHYSRSSAQKLVFFDHYYNKITLGGNRAVGAGSTGLDGRYWIDDFIVDDQRIGPTYFSLLNSSADTIAPSAPLSLSVQ